MVRILTLGFATLLTSFTQSSFADFAGVPTDRAAHYGMSFALTSAGYGLCKALVRASQSSTRDAFALQFRDAAEPIEHRLFCLSAGAVLAGTIGLIKEGLDLNRGGSAFDARGDLQADALGIATFALFTWVFEF